MFIEQLREKYRIGGDPHFPNKCVYTSGDGRSWELNDLRVQVWAHHLVRHSVFQVRLFVSNFDNRLRCCQLPLLIALPLVLISWSHSGYVLQVALRLPLRHQLLNLLLCQILNNTQCLTGIHHHHTFIHHHTHTINNRLFFSMVCMIHIFIMARIHEHQSPISASQMEQFPCRLFLSK